MVRRPAFLDSIRWRVQLLHGLLLAVVLLALGGAAYLVLLDRFMRDVDNEIYRTAFLIDGQLRKGAMADEALIVGKMTRKDLYGFIWLPSADVPAASSPGAPAKVPRPTGRHEGFMTRDGHRETFINSAPGRYVLVGRSLAQDRASWFRVALGLALGGVLIWGTVMLAGWWLVGKALRPLEDITSAAERIAGGDLSRRIPVGNPRTELGRLVVVLNATFERLEAFFARQTRFTADAAHELRTPVAIVLAHAQNGLSQQTLAPEERAAFEACHRAAQRMRRLIERLLQLARSDAGQPHVAREYDLARIAADAATLFRPLAGERNLDLQTDLAPARVSCDPDQLGQVVANLLDNAIACHDKSPGSISLSTRSEEKEAICEVADDGPGIAPEQIERIFERFYRVDKARTGRGGRSGLGLAISRAIVEAHGGTLTVRSTPGRGSVFTVRLPLCNRGAAMR